MKKWVVLENSGIRAGQGRAVLGRPTEPWWRSLIEGSPWFQNRFNQCIQSVYYSMNVTVLIEEVSYPGIYQLISLTPCPARTVRVHLVNDHGPKICWTWRIKTDFSWCRIWGYLVMTVINMTVRYFVIRLSTLKSIDQSEALTSLTNQRPRKCIFFQAAIFQLRHLICLICFRSSSGKSNWNDFEFAIGVIQFILIFGTFNEQNPLNIEQLIIPNALQINNGKPKSLNSSCKIWLADTRSNEKTE